MIKDKKSKNMIMKNLHFQNGQKLLLNKKQIKIFKLMELNQLLVNKNSMVKLQEVIIVGFVKDDKKLSFNMIWH